MSIKKELYLKTDLDYEFNLIRNTMSKDDVDYIVSRGEYLCAKLMAEYLGYDFIDAKEYIRLSAYMRRLPAMDMKIKELTKLVETLTKEKE